MKIYLRFFSLLLILTVPISMHAEIYSWTDATGNMVFSDQPQSNATVVQLPAEQVYSSNISENNQPDDNQGIVKNSFANDSPKYTRINLLSPSDEATIRDNNGIVTVNLELAPHLISGDQIAIVLDGHQLGQLQTITSFNLTNLDRGEHQLQINILNKNGQLVGSSQSVQFYMHRAQSLPDNNSTS